MSEIKVNSIKGVGASAAAITVNNTDGTCTANLSNRQNRNLIINGAMQVAQRGTSSTSAGVATVDRINFQYSGTDEAPTQAQVDVASGNTPYTLGFRKAYKVTNGNQTSGAGANDFFNLQFKLEAQDVANSGWNYKSSSSFITLSFYIKSSVAQTFKCYLRAMDGTSQQYPFETGSLSADTWTKVTKTISGNSNIQIDNDNQQGFQINIGAFWGTNYSDNSVTENAWGAFASSSRMKDNTSTWYTTNDATLEITGVQLEVGSVATDFEHRSFGQELALCQRYFYKTYDYGTAVGTNTTTGAFVRSLSTSQAYAAMSSVRYPVTMRAAPTVTAYSTETANTTGVMSADSSNKTIAIHYIGENGHFPFINNSSSGISTNVFLRHHFTAEAEL